MTIAQFCNNLIDAKEIIHTYRVGHKKKVACLPWKGAFSSLEEGYRKKLDAGGNQLQWSIIVDLY